MRLFGRRVLQSQGIGHCPEQKMKDLGWNVISEELLGWFGHLLGSGAVKISGKMQPLCGCERKEQTGWPPRALVNPLFLGNVSRASCCLSPKHLWWNLVALLPFHRGKRHLGEGTRGLSAAEKPCSGGKPTQESPKCPNLCPGAAAAGHPPQNISPETPRCDNIWDIRATNVLGVDNGKNKSRRNGNAEEKKKTEKLFLTFLSFVFRGWPLRCTNGRCSACKGFFLPK